MCKLVIVVSFPQRVDESYDAAGEDPSQATEELNSEQFASEGKPTTKLNPCPTFLFYILYYHVFNTMYLIFQYYYFGLGVLL